MKKHVSSLVLAAAVLLLFSSWSKLAYHFLFRNKAGNAAYALSVTHHQLHINNTLINYTATAGYMPIKDKHAMPFANIFYVAYQAGNQSANPNRPITFVFNGGPGSSAIWLHMASVGPVSVQFKNDKGDAPYQKTFAGNPYSWLGFTDLVFIDPVGTGYSRADENVPEKQFYNYDTDISTVGDFINNFLIQQHRQGSPKFLTGESYGAVRAIGLATYLHQQYQTAIEGITLISPALNYQLINYHHGNETPYSYYLPSYAITAQYHQLLSPELQQLSITQLLAKTKAFADGSYAKFLAMGDEAPPAFTNMVMDSLHYYTGLSKTYLTQLNGRVTDRQFSKTLLKQYNAVIGTFDSRFSGHNQNTDPSESNLREAVIPAFSNYISTELHYQNNLPYQATTAVGNWNYGPEANNSYLDVSENLKKLMTSNPQLKINVFCGYYDLATPVGSTEYAIRHLGLSAALRNNINLNYYQSGHMVYTSKTANAQFKSDGERFYQNALAN